MATSINKARTPVKRIQFALLGLLVGIIIGIAGVLLVQNSTSSNNSTHVEPSVVFDRIVSKSELVSASQRYNITDKTSNISSFFDWFDIPFTENSFWYRCVGTINAGVNLETAEFALDGNTVTVTLDKPYIISNTPDMEESGVLEENNNILNPIHIEDVDDFLRLCVEQSEESAVEGGLLDEAKANAEEDIKNMFDAALGDSYTVDIEWSA